MRLSLRWKIAGGFGLLLLLILLLGWVTLSLFGALRGVQSRVFDEALPGVVAIDGVVRSYTSQSAAVRGYLISTDTELLNQYRNEVGSARFWQRQAQGLFTSGKERRMLDRIERAGARYQRLVDEEVIPLIEQEGERSLAFSVLAREGSPLVERIQAVGRRLRTRQGRVVQATEDELEARNSQTLAILLVVTMGVALVGALLTVLLPRRLGSNLSQLVEAARAIERGDLDRRIEIHSRDEIEELALRFTEMQAGLKRLQHLAAQDRELEIAASIQKHLLQRSVPNTPGAVVVPAQRQANLVGGDFYDVHAFGGVVSMLVGDASGKGIGAALMSAVTLSVLRAERRWGADAKRVIQRANEALREATDPDAFTTLVYASLDLATGEVRCMNMGHPSPFVMRAGTGGDAGGYFLEGPRNRALGWFEDPGLAETMVRLEPGDRLVFYTDGFLEAKAPAGEIFGEHRFAQELASTAPLEPAAVGDQLVRAVETFAAGKLDDDLTVLVIEFRGAPLREGVGENLTGEEPWHSRR
ncbi:MAG: PP2C family protein-serine/threonine phosphatase [Actinomycetota bacterium]